MLAFFCNEFIERFCLSFSWMLAQIDRGKLKVFVLTKSSEKSGLIIDLRKANDFSDTIWRWNPLSFNRGHACRIHIYLFLSIVDTRDILVYQTRIKVTWFNRLVDSIFLSIWFITWHWNRFYDLSMCRMFPKMVNAEYIIILSLNTVISIIVMVWLSKVTWCLHRRIIHSHPPLASF